MPEITTCRDCGARGIEEWDRDPAPGLCPECFEKRLAPVAARINAETPTLVAYSQLRGEVGMTVRASLEFLNDLANQ